MRKFITRQGYVAYACTALETTYLGGFGVCDDCGKSAPNGFLVPVLNHYMCPACFEEWQARARFYPEDSPFEEKTPGTMSIGSLWIPRLNKNRRKTKCELIE